MFNLSVLFFLSHPLRPNIYAAFQYPPLHARWACSSTAAATTSKFPPMREPLGLAANMSYPVLTPILESEDTLTMQTS